MLSIVFPLGTPEKEEETFPRLWGEEHRQDCWSAV